MSVPVVRMLNFSCLYLCASSLLSFAKLIPRYVLESEHMKKFFDYIQLPNFDIAADAAATFKVKLFGPN